MGGNVSTCVSKCKPKKLPGGLLSKDLGELDSKFDESSNDDFFKFSRTNANKQIIGNYNWNFLKLIMQK